MRRLLGVPLWAGLILPLCLASSKLYADFGWEDDLGGVADQGRFDWDNDLKLIGGEGPDQFDQRQILGTTCDPDNVKSTFDCFALILRIDESKILSLSEDADAGSMALSSLGLVGLLDESETFLGETLKTYAQATKKLLRVCTETLEKRVSTKGLRIKNPACFIQVVNEETKDLYYGFPSYVSAIAVDINELTITTNANDLALQKNDERKYLELRISELQVNAEVGSMRYLIGSSFGGSGAWQSLPSDEMQVEGKKRFSSVDWKFNWQNILTDVSKIKLPSPTGLIDGFKNGVKGVFAKPDLASGALAAVAMGGHVVDSVCGEDKQRCGYERSSELVTSLKRSDRIYDTVIETLVKATVEGLYKAPDNKQALDI